MARHPWRAAAAVLGMAMGMAMVVTGAFGRDAMAVLLATQFSQVLRGDVSFTLLEAGPARLLHEVARLPDVSAVEGARVAPIRLSHAHYSWQGTVQGKVLHPELHRIVGLNRQVVEVPEAGLLLTDRLAQQLHVGRGDQVQLAFLEGRREVFELVVAGTAAELLGVSAYLERHALNRLLREGDRVNQVTVRLERGHEAAFLAPLKNLPQVAAVVSTSLMRRNIEAVTARNVRVFSAVLTAFATVIAVGVVYNNACIALAERAWALATLRVLGFSRREVSAFLFGELALAMALATPVGGALGYLLTRLIVGLTQTDAFLLPFVVVPRTYVLAVLCVLLAGAVSALVVRRRVDRLDLVAVLKTRE